MAPALAAGATEDPDKWVSAKFGGTDVTASRLAICTMVTAVLAMGCGSTAATTSPVGPSAAPSAASTQVATPSPMATLGTIGSADQRLVAGTYRLDLDKAVTVFDGKSRYGTIQVTVPDGWNSLGGWILNRGGRSGPTIAIQFWNVDQVYGHPCQWKGTLSRPGRGVDDLTKALVDKPMRNTSNPSTVTLGGATGKYLEWSVPTDINFAACDDDGGDHFFESWTGPGDSDRYQQGPGQIDRLWILDVGGSRLVIDAFIMPSANEAERGEIVAVVNSITFER